MSFSYWIRPYDQMTDRRRWKWQKPTQCGRYLPPHIMAEIEAAVKRKLEKEN